MISCDGILGLFKEAASKRIEQILLAEWQEKKGLYQREGQKRDELLERLNDAEKQVFEEYMEMVQESNNEKEIAIYQTGFLDGIYAAQTILNMEKINGGNQDGSKNYTGEIYEIDKTYCRDENGKFISGRGNYDNQK